MRIFNILLILMFVSISVSFAGNIKKGAYYLSNKHYKMGQEVKGDVKKGENSEIRFWIRDNFGTDLSDAKLASIAKDSSDFIKRSHKTHLANKWFSRSIKDGSYLIMGYTNSTKDEYSYVTIKKRVNDWIYTCDGSAWQLLGEDKDKSCLAKIGFDSVKFQFYNPKDSTKGFNKNTIVYGFLLIDK